jgi:NADH-quinone oxidoreductase subunit M
VFLGFFVAFAIKVPVFPFHTWLPDAHVEAPTPISVLLAGILLKMGAYGFVRISYPILPDGAKWFGPYLGVLAIIGIIYGGLVAFAQKDFKKMVAYSSVSHMGFVLLGLAAFTQTGFSGAILQEADLLSHLRQHQGGKNAPRLRRAQQSRRHSGNEGTGPNGKGS